VFLMNELSAAAVKPPEPSSLGAIERPIDLVHLARVTFGERSLEREVLQLFDRQAATLMERIHAAPAEDIPALAHTLKGSARAIGAVAVARAADIVEFMHPATEPDLRRAIAALRARAEESRAFIADLLRAH
jgi:HPt (histidine-containing phosphotransfer) domain-containing protein